MAGRWLDVQETADQLGISTDAVRKRVARQTLRSDRQDGRVVVWLDDGGSGESDALKSEPSGSDALIEAKDETIRVLREQLEAERQAHSEARRLLAAALERIAPNWRHRPESRRLLRSRQESPQRPGRGRVVPKTTTRPRILLYPRKVCAGAQRPILWLSEPR